MIVWNVYTIILTGNQMFVRADVDRTQRGTVTGWPFGCCVYRIMVRQK